MPVSGALPDLQLRQLRSAEATDHPARHGAARLHPGRRRLPIRRQYVDGAAVVGGVADNGAADLMHGEAGDDIMFGMTGSDIMFGGAGDDDMIGGYGHDWMSGGTGQDGMLGDDGLIYTSRNSSVYGEPLYGVAAAGQGPAAEVLGRQRAQRGHLHAGQHPVRRSSTVAGAQEDGGPGAVQRRPELARHGRRVPGRDPHHAVRRRHHVRRPGQRLDARRLRRRRHLRRRGADCGLVTVFATTAPERHPQPRLRRGRPGGAVPGCSSTSPPTATRTRATRWLQPGGRGRLEDPEPAAGRRVLLLRRVRPAAEDHAGPPAASSQVRQGTANEFLLNFNPTEGVCPGAAPVPAATRTSSVSYPAGPRRRRRRPSSAATATTGWSAAPGAIISTAAGATTCSTPMTTIAPTAA
jgi:hypothetical protein